MKIIKNSMINLLKKQNEFLPFHLLLILVFSLFFYFYSPYTDNTQDIENYKEYFQTLYYTMITHFTIGFGEITPKSKSLRMATMIHVFLTFLLFRI